MNKIWNEQNHNLEHKFLLFETLDIFKIVVISFMFILLLFMLFLHVCDLVRYVTFATNLNLLHKNKSNSTLPRSLMATLMPLILLLLFGLLSADSPENYLHLIFIFPKFDYGNMSRKALKCHKYFFQIYIAIVSIYIFYLATMPIESILCLLVQFLHSKWFSMGTNLAYNFVKRCSSESGPSLS